MSKNSHPIYQNLTRQPCGGWGVWTPEIPGLLCPWHEVESYKAQSGGYVGLL